MFSMGPLTAAWRTEPGKGKGSHPSAKKALKSHLLACHSSPSPPPAGGYHEGNHVPTVSSTDPEQHSQLLGEKRPPGRSTLMRRGFRDLRPQPGDAEKFPSEKC